MSSPPLATTMGCTPTLQQWLLLAALVVTPTTALRFIAAPLLPISPAMDIMGVAVQLRARGHDVLVVVTEAAVDFVQAAAARHSSNSSALDLQYLAVNVSWREFGRPQPLKVGEVPAPSRFAIPDTWPQPLWFKLTSGLDMLQLFQPGVAFMARQLLGNQTLVQTLRAYKADAWMSVGLSVGPAVKDSTGCIMAHALGIAQVDVSGNAFFDGPPDVPQFGTLLTPSDLKTLPGMSLNLASWALNRVIPFLRDLTPAATDKLRQEFGLPWATGACGALIQGLVRRLWGGSRGAATPKRCKPLVEVVMSSWLVEYPRRLAAHKVLVGPGTPRPAHAISQVDIATFVNSAPSGLVLVAFGTVYGPTLRPEDFMELARGFAALAPVRVLWALKQKSLRPGVALSDLPIGPNTLVVPWVDYNDVLGHPHTRAFVSHCGMHSVNEAAAHGVPLVALPFQMEQAENALKLQWRGAAVTCKQSPAFRRGSAAAEAMTFTAAHIEALIREVMANSSIASSAAAIGATLQRYAAQRHPYERAADEVELALLTAAAKTGRHPAGSGAMQQHAGCASCSSGSNSGSSSGSSSSDSSSSGSSRSGSGGSTTSPAGKSFDEATGDSSKLGSAETKDEL